MSPPLTPSAEEARRLLSEELSKPIYTDVQNWLWDQLEKLLEWLNNAPDPNTTPLSGGQGLWIGFGLAAVVAVVVWALMGPLRTERRRRPELFGDEELSSSDLRATASELAASGQWGPAVIELFRAMIRSLSERAIIEEFPGMTADEAGALAAVRLPDLAAGFTQAANGFDAIAYGHQDGSAEQYEQLAALDAEAAQTRPAALTAPIETTSAVEVSK
jgi:hypothetical protein